MQQYEVKKVKEPIDWMVEVPGSKSITNRALLMAALSDGPTQIDGALFSDDSRHFLASLRALGFVLEADEAASRVKIRGCGGLIPAKKAEIYVGSAGTAARFLTAMLGFSDGVYTIQASEQMKRRPMLPLFQLLEDVGAKITYLEKEGCLPVQICGRAYGAQSQSGQEGGEGQPPLAVTLDISKSTQFLSALLLISPMVCDRALAIRIVSEKTDGSYIRITRKMMEEFGAKTQFDGKNYMVPQGTCYHLEQYTVEPDMSAACYFYAAAALTGGRALVKNVHADNSQGDIRFLDVLRQMGCRIEDCAAGILLEGPLDGTLKGVSVNMNDFSDQALTLAAIAPFADAPVEISGIGHIRGQESDRLAVIVKELTKLGVRCEEKETAVTIFPGTPHAGEIDTYDDHRVAMAFSLIGLRVAGIVIRDPLCCRKTFEHYFDVLTELTAG